MPRAARSKTSHPPAPPAPNERIRIVEERLLSNHWFTLKTTSFQYLRSDGSWQLQQRETYDRGNGAVLLLFNARRGTVVLTRQFRFPAYVNGCADGMLIEACAGLLDGDDPYACIQREAEEETGFIVRSPRKLFEAYMSPGSVTEKLHFFAAEYEEHDRVAAGGGDAAEGEDIEVIEMPLDEAMRQVANGTIQDGKTIMLLQHAALCRLGHSSPETTGRCSDFGAPAGVADNSAHVARDLNHRAGETPLPRGTREPC